MLSDPHFWCGAVAGVFGVIAGAVLAVGILCWLPDRSTSEEETEEE